MLLLRSKQEIIVVVLPVYVIRDFVAVDIIGSTAFYYAVKLALKKLVYAEPLAIAGSIVLPVLYKKIARRSSKAAGRHHRGRRAQLPQFSGVY